MFRLWIALFLTLAACSSRVDAPIIPDATQSGTLKTIFVGTTRAVTDEGSFGIGRDPNLRLLQYKVSIPKSRELGSISDGLGNPKPGRDFVLAGSETFSDPGAFRQAVRNKISATAHRGGHDATIYVHGYNNSFTDPIFRVAQLTHDLDLAGPAIGYAWPSRAHPLGYEYDTDSALFARDGLVELLTQVKNSGVRRIVLVAHSLGSSLVMEALRQIELTSPGWAHASLGGVLLISPDLNVDVFRAQSSAFRPWPQPFVIFSSRRDGVLRLSARLRGESTRLGNLRDVDEISDLPVSFVDVTALSQTAENRHFVAGTSDSFIRILRQADNLDREFLRGQNAASPSVLGVRRVTQNATQIIFLPGER